MLAGSNYVLVVNIGADVGTNFQVGVKKPSNTSYTILDETTTSPTYAVDGYYNFNIPGQYLDEEGTYVFKITDLSQNPNVDYMVTKEATLAPFNANVPPEICVVTGTLRDITGGLDNYKNVIITARPLHLPLNSNGILVLGQSVFTYADFQGNFSLPLIKNMTALLEIKDAGVRFQATIPDLPTVDFASLIPTE